MENTAEIERIFYWDRDSTTQKSIVKYMEELITVSDIILIVCTEASNESGPVQQETFFSLFFWIVKEIKASFELQNIDSFCDDYLKMTKPVRKIQEFCYNVDK